MSGPRLALAIALAALVAGACGRAAAEDGADGVVDDAQVVATFADPSAPTIAELQAAHPEATGAGDACNVDAACVAPLRCLGGTCDWPPSMTGAETAETPFLILSGAEGESRYFVELALDSSAQARGLMHRRNLVPDWGMLFVFPGDRPRSFWMRNTLISLDMVFIRGDGVIDSFQENTEPLTETPRPSEGPARYVLELNAGDVARLGLSAGDRVEFVNLVPELAPAP